MPSVRQPGTTIHGEEGSRSDFGTGRPPAWKTFRFWRSWIVLLLAMPFLGFGVSRILYQRQLDSARRLIAQWQDRPAHDALLRLEKRYGMTGETSLLKARAQRHLRNFERSDLLIRFARQLGGNPPEVDREAMLLSAQMGDLSEVSKEFPRLIQEAGSDLGEVLHAFSIGSLIRMQFRDALGMVGIWTKELPQDGMPYVVLGMLAQYRQQWTQASDAFAEALKRQPYLAAAQFGMAETKRHLNQWEEAVTYYRQYLQQQPASIEARKGMAESLLGTQKPQEAISLLEALVAEGKRDFEAQLLLGRSLLDEGRAKEAIERMAPLRELWPDDVDMNYALARAYAQDGQDSMAEPLFAKTEEGNKFLKDIDLRLMDAERQPNNAQLLYQVGHDLLHYSSRDEGRVWLQAALQANPSMLEAHQDLYLLFSRSGDTAQAAVHRSAVIQLGGTIAPESAGGSKPSEPAVNP
jgi:tetratricopeptide (TPR) repeat protein